MQTKAIVQVYSISRHNRETVTAEHPHVFLTDRLNLSSFSIVFCLFCWHEVRLSVYLGYNWRLCGLYAESFPVETLIPPDNHDNGRRQVSLRL